MKKQARVLLKISGEAFSDGEASLSPSRFNAVVDELLQGVAAGVEIAIVVGGGNFLRGASIENPLLHRVTADQMGILATVLNGLALRDAIEARGGDAELMSALPIEGVVDAFDYRMARKALAHKKIVIFAGGTGNPFVTTDSAASLRAVEIGATVLLKATKVDGIYDKDPHKHTDAVLFEHLTFSEVLQKELAVMDLAAFCQCRDYHVAIQIFNLFKPGALSRVLLGHQEGTLVD